MEGTGGESSVREETLKIVPRSVSCIEIKQKYGVTEFFPSPLVENRCQPILVGQMNYLLKKNPNVFYLFRKIIEGIDKKNSKWEWEYMRSQRSALHVWLELDDCVGLEYRVYVYDGDQDLSESDVIYRMYAKICSTWSYDQGKRFVVLLDDEQKIYSMIINHMMLMLNTKLVPCDYSELEQKYYVQKQQNEDHCVLIRSLKAQNQDLLNRVELLSVQNDQLTQDNYRLVSQLEQNSENDKKKLLEYPHLIQVRDEYIRITTDKQKEEKLTEKVLDRVLTCAEVLSRGLKPAKGVAKLQNIAEKFPNSNLRRQDAIKHMQRYNNYKKGKDLVVAVLDFEHSKNVVRQCGVQLINRIGNYKSMKFYVVVGAQTPKDKKRVQLVKSEYISESDSPIDVTDSKLWTNLEKIEKRIDAWMFFSMSEKQVFKENDFSLDRPVFDCQVFADLLPDAESYPMKLSVVAEKMGMTMKGYHNAGNDAIMTANIFFELYMRYGHNDYG